MQRFTFAMADPSYDLHLKQTLTIKPRDFYIHAIPRTDRKGIPLFSPPSASLSHDTRTGKASEQPDTISSVDMKPLYVLYGSNTGTSEAFAQRVASTAAEQGMSISRTDVFCRLNTC